MAELIFAAVVLAALFALSMNRAPLWAWAVFVAVVTLALQAGVASGNIGVPEFGTLGLIGWVPAVVLGLFSLAPLRKALLIRPAYGMVKRILPPVSATEQEALDAGTVGFDAEIFKGQPDWQRLRAVPSAQLAPDEQAFFDNETEELCRMLDDWQVRHALHEIPAHIWQFVRDKGFLGMLISKEHGGLGFSPQAQSMIIGKIGTRCPDAAIIVMVPNSLGPGELIEKFGTDYQKHYFLPRLAKGLEIPCFALTGPNSGSDAASMRDIGIVTKGMHQGQEVTGVRVTWNKRYITLAPNATLLGLAFRLFDPENLLGKGEDIGITLAMIPSDHPGVEIGNRHLPNGAAFPNGPTWGKDVFIPLDFIIGGEARVGQGWRMLMSCLSAGRAISLPATSAAGIKALLRSTSAYARVRKQFGIAVGRMEGVEERLARIVEQAYITESGRAVTASMVAGGEKPSVISALLKYQSTERMRIALNDAMDIHAGKAICDGPGNYLQGAYQSMPVAITVEGANILTRTLITFAQGALRSHPYLYAEVQAAQNPDRKAGLADFERAFMGHAGWMLSNIFGALFHNLSFGRFASSPDNTAGTGPIYRQLARNSRNFALAADMTVALLGGGLKTKQKVTGRLADALSELYLVACMLKRFEDDGQPAADLPILEYCAQNAFHRFQEAMDGVTRNFPVAGMGFVMRRLIFPLGKPYVPASDEAQKVLTRAVLEPGAVRDRLTRGIYHTQDPNDGQGVVEYTFLRMVAADEALRKLDRAIRKGDAKRFYGHDWVGEAERSGAITAQEAAQLRELEPLIERVIAVDHFEAAAVRPHYQAEQETANAAQIAAQIAAE